MTHSDMRAFHTVQKEFTPWSAWLFTRAVIGMVAVLSFAPFIVYSWR